jgi:hypothetical protein
MRKPFRSWQEPAMTTTTSISNGGGIILTGDRDDLTQVLGGYPGILIEAI